MNSVDYRYICPCCNNRYGVAHQRGWVDVRMCDTCKIDQPKRYGDGKFNSAKYRQIKPSALVAT